jgi:hypothetical protein
MDFSKIRFTLGLYLGDDAVVEKCMSDDKLFDAFNEVRGIGYPHLYSEEDDKPYLDIKEVEKIAKELNKCCKPGSGLEIKYEHHNNRIDAYVCLVGEPCMWRLRFTAKADQLPTEQEMCEIETGMKENTLA